ncbi:beta-arrestin arr-1-like [Tachypleus tridentatus]|uniref:beta-arrestin arr-1-like n=1 Tax=Tachypleus tridentatus TaxID=6853 RepID=UPI003FD6117F
MATQHSTPKCLESFSSVLDGRSSNLNRKKRPQSSVIYKKCGKLSHKKDTVRPSWPITGQPSASISKDFPLSSGKIFLEATLDKKLYYHGEEIIVSVLIQNFSHKTVKHVKVSVIQVADICMVSSGKWKVTVASLDSQANCPIVPGSTYHKRFDLLPHIWNIKDKYGVFTNNCSWVENDSLASSVLVPEKEIHEFFGILISYQVKVKMYIGSLKPLRGSDSSVFLPFYLMYRNPAKLQNNDILDSEHSSPIPLVNSINYKKTDGNSDKDNYNCSDDVIVDDLTRIPARRVPLIT